MAKLKSNTRIFGTASIDGILTVGQVSPQAASSNTSGSLQVVGGLGMTGDLYANSITLSGNTITSNTNTLTLQENVLIDSSGRVIIGGQSNQTLTSVNNLVQVQQLGSGFAYTAVRYTNDEFPSAIMQAKSRGTSAGVNTVVNNNDNISS
jgi:hypothetical protein